MASSKMTKAITNAAIKGSSISHTTNQIQGNPVSSTRAAPSAKPYDRRH